MWRVVGVDDEEAGFVGHVLGLDAGGDAACAAPKQCIFGSMELYFRPERSLEVGVLRSLLLYYICASDSFFDGRGVGDAFCAGFDVDVEEVGREVFRDVGFEVGAVVVDCYEAGWIFGQVQSCEGEADGASADERDSDWSF